MGTTIEAESAIEAKNLKQRDTAWTEVAIKKFLPAPTTEERYSHINGRFRVRLFTLADVVTAEESQAFAVHKTNYLSRQRKKNETKELPLIDAIREASRSAHRWRDRASERWNGNSRRSAGTASQTKRHWYDLKDKGVVAAYEQGLLRYAGQTSQGLAVYEYGSGGMSCFHSTLHPAGAERPLVDGHPEILTVPAKDQEHRLADVEHTLSSLPEIDSQKYSRSAAPEMRRERPQGPQCWKCGEYGHLARECPAPDGGWGEEANSIAE